MKRSTPLLITLLVVFLTSCSTEQKPSIAALKAEIVAAEKAFSDMSAEKGTLEAFLHFSAENVAIKRGGKVLEGKEALREYYSRPSSLTNELLQWEPSFVDVSESGDLAYTYGPFTFTAIDSTGAPIKSEGFFHTVWKRQEDGTWKFVYD